MKLWFAQLALNFLWSPVFFGAHWVGLAIVIVLVLLAAIVVFIVQSWPRDRAAAVLLVPYSAWIGFAMLLNGSIWMLN